MSEQTTNEETPKEESFSYQKARFTPLIKEAVGILIESGLDIQTTEVKRARRKLTRRLVEKTHESETDQMTGLLNRRGFNRRLQEEISRAEREDYNLWILYLDLNKLKKINTEEGHAAGDAYIMKTSDILRKGRKSDIISRQGGDEFAILLPKITHEGIEEYWKRLSQELAEENITVCAGASGVDLKNPAESIHIADRAMESIKQEAHKTGLSYIVIKS